MGTFNRIEIYGKVGDLIQREEEFVFSVSTAFMDRADEIVWFEVRVGRKADGYEWAESLGKGTAVHVKGRVRPREWVAGDGEIRTRYYVMADLIEEDKDDE